MKITNNGKTLNIPLSVFDITVSRDIDFRKCIERYTAEKDKEFNIDSFANEQSCIIEAVACACEGDLIHELPFDISGKDESETVYTNTAQVEDISILGLFYHVQNITAQYEVDERILQKEAYSFFYKGETFILNNGLQSIKTGNVLESLEIERMNDEMKKKEGDTEGVLQFTKMIRTCAILCRKENEYLPINKRERDLFLEQRTEFFKDLTLNIANDITFFLCGTIMKFLKIQDTRSSL